MSVQKTVIRNRSTASMVFSLCLMNFIVAVSWSLYGFVVKDMFIQVPLSHALLLLGLSPSPRRASRNSPLYSSSSHPRARHWYPPPVAQQAPNSMGALLSLAQLLLFVK